MSRLLHKFRLWLARRLAAVELHRCEEPSDAETVIRKRRSRLSQFLIPPGNLYLRLMGADSFVLAETAWHRWEAAVSGAQSDGRDVLIPRVRGEVLSAVLQSQKHSFAEKREAIRLAMQALRDLHSRQVSLAGSLWMLSHGDATADNVRVDLEAGTAGWFDFDMRHRSRLSEHWRHADDLRAYVFSCASMLSEPSAEFFAELIASHCDSDARCEFVTRLQNDWQRPACFHLAQAPLYYGRYRAFRVTLLECLAAEASRTIIQSTSSTCV